MLENSYVVAMKLLPSLAAMTVACWGAFAGSLPLLAESTSRHWTFRNYILTVGNPEAALDVGLLCHTGAEMWGASY